MIDLGKIPEEQKTPLVMELLHVIGQLTEQTERLREEVARLKEHKGKPKIPPSRLEKDPKEKQKKKDRKKRPGSKKRSKTKQLTIHETISVRHRSGAARQRSTSRFFERIGDPP